MWLAIGALVVGAPTWVAVRVLVGRGPAARARAAVFGSAPTRGRLSAAALRSYAAAASAARDDAPAPSAETAPVRPAATELTARRGVTPAQELDSGPAGQPAPPPVADAAPAPAGPEQDLAHLRLWSGVFAGGRALARIAEAPDGSSASPPTRMLAGVLRRALAHGSLAPAPDLTTSVPGMRAQALAGERSAALWLLAPGEGWGEPVERARVTLRDLEPGRWRVTWLDDVTGAELASEERDLGEVAALAVPTFARHIAAVLERADAQ